MSGVISAMRKNMDVVGIVVCGFLAAFGGGTLRDVLIDRRPFFWVDHQLVLMGCCCCAWRALLFFSNVIWRAAKSCCRCPMRLVWVCFVRRGYISHGRWGSRPALPS